MRRAKPITRDALVTRLARLRGSTFGDAWDSVKHMDTDHLRALVEQSEGSSPEPRHRSEDWDGGITR